MVKQNNGRYTIIAGERRWRAARTVSLEKIPAIILDIDEKKMLEMALIEDLQREDLNPIEEAEGNKQPYEGLQSYTRGGFASRIGEEPICDCKHLKIVKAS